VRRQGGEQWSCYFFFVRNSLTASEVCAGALSWCNNQSSILPHLRPFAPHVFPQSSQNLAVKLPIDSLTSWNKFLMHGSSNVKKKISIGLMLLLTWRSFFRSRRGWCLPLRGLLLCFRIITVQP